MARCLWIVVASLLAANRAHAAVGDTLEQLRAVYGSASEVGNQMLFRHDGYSIAVYFDSTRSAMEIFVRDGSVKDKPEITQADIDQILVLEGAGQPWSPVRAHSGQPTWVRADGKLIARFNPSEKILAVLENAK